MHSAVLAVDAPFDQSFRGEPVNNLANVGSVDARQHGKTALISPGEVVDDGEHRILQGHRQLLIRNRFREHRQTNLVEAAGERKRRVVRDDRVRRRDDFGPRIIPLRDALVTHSVNTPIVRIVSIIVRIMIMSIPGSC